MLCEYRGRSADGYDPDEVLCDLDAEFEGFTNAGMFFKVCGDHEKTLKRAVPLDPEYFNGQRMRLAREVAGISREDLAETLGISEWELWLMEMKGAEVPDEVRLGIMQAGLGFSPRFFLQPDGPRLENSTLFWHLSSEDLCGSCGDGLASALCDHPLGDGTTCDLRLCDDCRDRVDVDTDLCPEHKREVRTT